MLKNSKLSVTRDSGFADRIRAYTIFVNNKKIGSINNGETKEFEFEVLEGVNTIYAKIDWQKSEVYEFQGDEKLISFSVYSKLRGWRLFTSGFIGFIPNSWIGIERVKV